MNQAEFFGRAMGRDERSEKNCVVCGGCGIEMVGESIGDLCRCIPRIAGVRLSRRLGSGIVRARAESLVRALKGARITDTEPT